MIAPDFETSVPDDLGRVHFIGIGGIGTKFFRWRLDALDLWRKDVDHSLGSIDERLKGLLKADEIAEAVAQKMRSERTLGLTFVQKLGVFVVGAVAVAGGLKGLIG